MLLKHCSLKPEWNLWPRTNKYRIKNSFVQQQTRTTHRKTGRTTVFIPFYHKDVNIKEQGRQQHAMRVTWIITVYKSSIHHDAVSVPEPLCLFCFCIVCSLTKNYWYKVTVGWAYLQADAPNRLFMKAVGLFSLSLFSSSRLTPLKVFQT